MPNKIAQFKTHSKRLAVAFVQRGSLQAANELRAILGPQGGKRTGVVYTKGKNGTIKHQASAPGESPAPDTGRLRQSATHETVRVEGDKVIGGAGVSAPYAAALEFGTETIEPRPFMSRLLTEPHKGNINRAAQGALK